MHGSYMPKGWAKSLFILLPLSMFVLSGCYVRGRASVTVPRPQARVTVRAPQPHVHAHHHRHHRGARVVINRGHRHDDRCGHYYYRGEWYEERRHVHTRGCGHEFRGGIWIIVE